MCPGGSRITWMVYSSRTCMLPGLDLYYTLCNIWQRQGRNQMIYLVCPRCPPVHVVWFGFEAWFSSWAIFTPEKRTQPWFQVTLADWRTCILSMLYQVYCILLYRDCSSCLPSSNVQHQWASTLITHKHSPKQEESQGKQKKYCCIVAHDGTDSVITVLFSHTVVPFFLPNGIIRRPSVRPEILHSRHKKSCGHRLRQKA